MNQTHQKTLIHIINQPVENWQAAADARAIFLQCYLLMTRNMFAAIDMGEFSDSAWVRSLLNRFAQHYFDALDAYEHDPDSTLKVWLITHKAAERADTLVTQNLMLGINAHINYDLVFALVEMLEDEWPALSPEQRRARYVDHSHVNHVIGRTIDAVQDHVISRLVPAFCIVDKALGPVDEWATTRLVTRWRDTVWDQAVRILASRAGGDREELRIEVEQIALARAAAILLTKNVATLAALR
jgi:hypothetical protein